MGLKTAALAVGVVAVALGAIAVAPKVAIAVNDEATYGTMDTTGPPPRVDYCGRRYYPGGRTMTMSQVEAFVAVNGDHGLTRVATAPSGMPILANVMTPATRGQFHTNVCTMEVFVQTGQDAYLSYGLSGGP